MGNRFVGILITGALSLLAWGYYLLPDRLRAAAGRNIGRLLRRKELRGEVVRENLARALPGETPEDEERRRSVFDRAYEHLGHLGFEILMLFGPMGRFARHKSRLVGAEHWRAASERGKGVIFLSSHVGNWEVMAATGAIHGGIDLMIVTKKLKPEWLHRAIERGRARCGVKGTYEPKTLKEVMAHLKNGRTVGFILDQYAGPPIGIRVPFFGVPVGTASIVAVLARRTGAPVLPVVNHRDGRGGFVVEIRPPLEWIRDDDATLELAKNTAEYAAILERDVRDHSDQWLWIHKRFKGDLSPLKEGEWSQFRTRR